MQIEALFVFRSRTTENIQESFTWNQLFCRTVIRGADTSWLFFEAPEKLVWLDASTMELEQKKSWPFQQTKHVGWVMTVLDIFLFVRHAQNSKKHLGRVCWVVPFVKQFNTTRLNISSILFSPFVLLTSGLFQQRLKLNFLRFITLRMLWVACVYIP